MNSLLDLFTVLFVAFTAALLGIVTSAAWRRPRHRPYVAAYVPTLPPAPQRVAAVIVLPTLHERCAWCGQKVRVRPDGTLSKHVAYLSYVDCDGSYDFAGRQP